MNPNTRTLIVDNLLLLALQEDISSEDVTTNAVMPEACQGTVQLLCKQDGIIAGMEDEEELLAAGDDAFEDEDDLLSDVAEILGDEEDELPLDEEEDDEIKVPENLDAILKEKNDGFDGDYLDSDEVESLDLIAEEEDFDDDDVLF